VSIIAQTQQVIVVRIAMPICRDADIPAALVGRYLGEFAERHSGDSVCSRAVRGRAAARYDSIRRNALLHPPLEGGEHVKGVVNWTSPAVVHARLCLDQGLPPAEFLSASFKLYFSVLKYLCGIWPLP